MERTHRSGWSLAMGLAVLVPAVVGLVTPVGLSAQQAAPAAPAPAVTFTKDIAPILQRSCQNCHRPNQVAPMSLITYEEVRPWARAIRQRTEHPRQGRRDAALVHREEHRHPEVQARPVAVGRGSREDRAVGGERSAARERRRHARAAPVGGRCGLDDRRARPHRRGARDRREGEHARLVGRARAGEGSAGRGSLRGGGRNQGSQRRPERCAGTGDGGPTLCVPPSDSGPPPSSRRAASCPRAQASAAGRSTKWAGTPTSSTRRRAGC